MTIQFSRNYRPIILLPTVSKLIEKFIYTQIFSFCVAQKLFYEYQFGFRSGHSTELAAIELVDRINMQLDNNKVPIHIFLDLSKAFDTINHTIIIAR